MEKLIIKIPGTPAREVDLAPGVHKVGRSLLADLQIDHPSVSSSHCEISVDNGALAIKDLGSTNGTLLDGQRVEQAAVAPGQVMRMGEVEVLYAAPIETKAGLRLASVPTMAAPVAAAPPPYVPRLIPPKPAARARNFYKSIPGAFVYPFKRNGWILLLSGTLIFGVFDCLLSFRIGGFLVVGGLLGGLFSAGITGYIFLYLQTIITATAMGGEDMPPWPDYEGWWDSAIGPYLRLLVISIVCIGPAFLCLRISDDYGPLLFIPVLFLGFCYAPMALLAVAMDDSLLGLNPLLVISAIIRVALEYLVTCLLLGALVFILGAMIALLHFLWMLWFYSQQGVGLPVGVIRPRIAPESIVMHIPVLFLSLYFFVVEMRLLGLLYFTRKDRFGWRA